ncbi:COP9 signalosome complex subunit 4 [Perkinsus chesapeaki]|uniref:COP9 signalosome complex subunit 4 n=1 Tax=Perkinsus chesapeaki TaxID=330153 RepID=A0A7J6MY01_PERCH|nr:COP9 signalosome complex subunit 4 [Perkinsus chesapeaki]
MSNVGNPLGGGGSSALDNAMEALKRELSNMLRRPMPMDAVEKEKHLSRAVCNGGDVKVLAGIDLGYEQALLRIMYAEKQSPDRGGGTIDNGKITGPAAGTVQKKKRRPVLLPADPTDKRRRLAIPLQYLEGQNEEYTNKIPITMDTVNERLNGTTAYRGGITNEACNAVRAMTSNASSMNQYNNNANSSSSASSSSSSNLINGQPMVDNPTPIMSIFNFPQKSDDFDTTEDSSFLEGTGGSNDINMMGLDRTTPAHVYYTLNLMPRRFYAPCSIQQLPLKIPRQLWPVWLSRAHDKVIKETLLSALNKAYPNTTAIDNIIHSEIHNVDRLVDVARMVITSPNSGDNQNFTRAVIHSMCHLTSDLPNDALEEFSVHMLELLDPSSQPVSPPSLDSPHHTTGCPPGVEEEIVKLRVNLSEIHQANGDFIAAAKALSQIDSDGRGGSGPAPSLRSIAARCEHFTKIAELFLEGGDDVSAESYISRAAMIVPDLGKDDVGLQLRFKVCQARIFDARRKFLDAAYKYLEVALGPYSSSIEADDISQLLLGAARCVVLAPAGLKKRRILQMIISDTKCEKSIPSSEWDILLKIKNLRVIYPKELQEFEKGLSEHHLALGSDGMTVLSRAITEHNIVAISHLYNNISLSRLADILDTTPSQVEVLASNMISEDRLRARIDQLSQYMLFSELDTEGYAVDGWARSLRSLCANIDSTSNAIVDLSIGMPRA